MSLNNYDMDENGIKEYDHIEHGKLYNFFRKKSIYDKNIKKINKFVNKNNLNNYFDITEALQLLENQENRDEMSCKLCEFINNCKDAYKKEIFHYELLTILGYISDIEIDDDFEYKNNELEAKSCDQIEQMVEDKGLQIEELTLTPEQKQEKIIYKIENIGKSYYELNEIVLNEYEEILIEDLKTDGIGIDDPEFDNYISQRGVNKEKIVAYLNKNAKSNKSNLSSNNFVKMLVNKPNFNYKK